MSPDGYFTDESMLRRVNRERVLALAGPRALLMQAAHPLAVAGLLAHSTALDDPYERLARTAQVLNAIGFGSRDDSDRVTARVRAMHRRVRGASPQAVGPTPIHGGCRTNHPTDPVRRSVMGRPTLSAAEGVHKWEANLGRAMNRDTSPTS